jgi:hypothetical protein
MLITVTELCHLGDYRLSLRFNTGEHFEVDLNAFVQHTPAAAALKDVGEFKKAALDEWPTVVWPCGFDLSPEYLYSLATGKPQAWESGAGNPRQVAA